MEHGTRWPLPTAAEDHQTFNARALEDAGAARVLPEAELDAARLADEIASVAADTTALEAMRSAARGRARPDATRAIASDVAAFLSPVRRAA